MLFKIMSVSALSVVALLAQTSTQSSIHHRRARALYSDKSDSAFKVRRDVSQAELSQLQSEYTMFKGWMNTFLSAGTPSDQSVAQLKTQFTAYDGWITAFFGQASIGAAPASAALAAASAPAALAAASAPAASPLAASAASPMAASGTAAGVSPPAASAASPAAGGSTPAASGPLSDSETAPPAVFNAGTANGGTAGTAAPTMPATSPAASTPAGTAPASAPTTAASPPFPANSSTPAAAAAPAGTGSAGSGGSLQAVYYGQSANTSQVPLSRICAGNTVDIVILAFLSTFAGPGGYPKVDFGGACPAAAILGSSATGLLNCPALAANITDCQKAGKKVFLSIGGFAGSVDIASAADASTYATNVWNIFGGGKSTVGRPFGDVKLDGFDVDTESKKPANWDTFVSSLRGNFKSDSSKIYYISAAPQCPIPDASIPLDAMLNMDYVWVQFYNNGDCNVGASGFLASMTNWSKQLVGANGGGPKLLFGGPACETCGPHGYLAPSAMPSVISAVKAANLKNYGGMMVWDGAEAVENVVGGKNYMEIVRAAL